MQNKDKNSAYPKFLYTRPKGLKVSLERAWLAAIWTSSSIY